MFIFCLFIFQQKLQLKKKKKKEREALGDKVSKQLLTLLQIDSFCTLNNVTALMFGIHFLYFIPFLMQAPPKEVPKTIENQRVYDETTVDPEDEEVLLCLAEIRQSQVIFVMNLC